MIDLSASLLAEPALLGAALSALLSAVSFAVWAARKPAPASKPVLSAPAERSASERSALQPEQAAVPAPPAARAAAATSAHETPPSSLSWAARLRQGLKRTHLTLVRQVDELLASSASKATHAEIFNALFESLVRADVGVRTSEQLVERAKERFRTIAEVNAASLKKVLQEEILTIFAATRELSQGTLEAPLSEPHVVMMVGVNGVGKTTTTGKLAYKAAQRRKKCVVGAADTFRAAAVEQLAVWAERAGAECVRLKEGADPASVAFEAAKRAIQGNAAVCFLDTAGRLHNRKDLMSELEKIKRSVTKSIPTAPHEVLLVLDATTGQNALQQARAFQEVVQVTGLVLTKLDGTAKGGVVIGIANELKLPVRYIGVGEAVEDLEAFDAAEFVAALFSELP